MGHVHSCEDGQQSPDAPIMSINSGGAGDRHTSTDSLYYRFQKSLLRCRQTKTKGTTQQNMSLLKEEQLTVIYFKLQNEQRLVKKTRGMISVRTMANTNTVVQSQTLGLHGVHIMLYRMQSM